MKKEGKKFHLLLYSDLYSRIEFDYTREKDDNVIVRQYSAVYIGKDFKDKYTSDNIQNFYMTAFETLSFKINNKNQRHYQNLEIRRIVGYFAGLLVKFLKMIK